LDRPQSSSADHSEAVCDGNPAGAGAAVAVDDVVAGGGGGGASFSGAGAALDAADGTAAVPIADAAAADAAAGSNIAGIVDNTVVDTADNTAVAGVEFALHHANRAAANAAAKIPGRPAKGLVPWSCFGKE